MTTEWAMEQRLPTSSVQWQIRGKTSPTAVVRVIDRSVADSETGKIIIKRMNNVSAFELTMNWL